MITRCIYLRPDHPRLHDIQELRLKYDSLAEKVPPHITLVFPFVLDWQNDELIAILNQALKVEELRFSLGAPVESDGFLYFPLEEGSKQVEMMHDSIYDLLPSSLLLKEYPYVPHITFGRLRSDQDISTVLNEAQSVLTDKDGIIRSVVLERIGKDDNSIVEYEKMLVSAAIVSD